MIVLSPGECYGLAPPRKQRELVHLLNPSRSHEPPALRKDRSQKPALDDPGFREKDPHTRDQ